MEKHYENQEFTTAQLFNFTIVCGKKEKKMRKQHVWKWSKLNRKPTQGHSYLYMYANRKYANGQNSCTPEWLYICMLKICKIDKINIIFFGYKTDFFPSKTEKSRSVLKDDLDLWGCLGRVNLVHVNVFHSPCHVYAHGAELPFIVLLAKCWIRRNLQVYTFIVALFTCLL